MSVPSSKLVFRVGIYEYNVKLLFSNMIKYMCSGVQWTKMSIQTAKTVKLENPNVIASLIRGKSGDEPFIFPANAHNLLWAFLLVRKLKILITYDPLVLSQFFKKVNWSEFNFLFSDIMFIYLLPYICCTFVTKIKFESGL